MPGDQPALEQGQPGDVDGDRHRHRDHAADVGDEALRGGVADVVLDDLVDGLARRRRAARSSCLSAAAAAGGSGPTPVDGAVQRLVHEARASARARALKASRLADAWRRCPCGVSFVVVRTWVNSPNEGRSPTCSTDGCAMPVEPPVRWLFPDIAALPAGASPTTWWRSGPTSSRARCWRPTAAGCSRCRAEGRRRTLLWWSPVERGVLPLDGLRVTRSLRQSRRRMEIRVDTAFDEVVAACADPRREGGWIDGPIVAAYTALHRAGLGALGGGLAGRRAGRRPVRRRDRRPVRRRVDVPPGQRRVEGGAGRAGRPAPRRARRPAAARRAVATPHLASLGVVDGAPRGVPRRAAGRRSTCRCRRRSA